MPSVLITGASRGLGLEFTAQYANKGWNVLAACRAPEQAEKLSLDESGSFKVFDGTSIEW